MLLWSDGSFQFILLNISRVLMYEVCSLCTKGGFNDILGGLGKSIEYCKKYNRTLLFAMKLSCYSIELGDYFDLEDLGIRILYDTAQIKTHLMKTVYDMDLKDIFDGKIIFTWGRIAYTYKDVLCTLPEEVEENVILYVLMVAIEGSICSNTSDGKTL
uniref:Uncharacterized protein n=1 Tax=viral metagenome TaxID=1070528 RepID=A0A6C0AI29_9ZZZZ